MFTTTPHISRSSLVVARIASTLAMVLSGYMLYVSIKHFGVNVRWGAYPCVDATQTRWGYWLNMPIALPGLITYTFVAYFTWFRAKAWDDELTNDRLWPWMVIAVTLAGASGLWLLGAQIGLLRYVCPACMFVNLCGIWLFLIFVFLTRSRPWHLAFSIFAAGVILVMQFTGAVPTPKAKAGVADAGTAAPVLTPEVPPDVPPNTDLSQIIYDLEPNPIAAPANEIWEGEADQPLTFVPIVSSVTETAEVAVVEAAPVLSAPRNLDEVLADAARANSTTTVERTHFDLGAGKIYLKVDEAPYIGSPNAPHVMAMLYDYTDPQSIAMLRHMRRQVVRYRGALAVALLPMPRDAECNDNMRFTPPEFVGACEYARISIQIWLTNPTKHVDFQEYVVTPKKGQPLSKAAWVADKLIDKEALSDFLLNQLTEKQIGRNCTYWKALDFGLLPKLIFKDGVVSGTPQNNEDMDAFMDGQLGILSESVR